LTFNLLPDQQILIERARDKVKRGCKSLLIQGATGSGKTVIASEIISGAYKKDKICFFLVPRRDLLRQTSNTLKEFGIPHSFIAAGIRCDTRAKIFVCSTMTVKNKLAIVPDIAIIDEGHVGGAGMDKIIARYKAAGTVIIMLSATPWKLSGRGLGCWVDDMVCGPSIRWLIDNKRLSEYRAFAPSTPDLSGIRTTAGDYNNKQLSKRMEDNRVLVGNAVKHYQDHANGRLNIAYCVSRKHSEITAQAFRDAGVPAQHMDGETPDEERVRIVRAYARRELLVLTNCDLLTFGFDLSSASGMAVTVESMSDLRPTKSLALQMQKWGRVLRYKEYPALIFDHANNFQEHGLPDSDREWTLSDREKTGRGDVEKTFLVRQCMPAEDADGVMRGCYHCHKPAPVCPNCGRVYIVQSREISEIAGDLSEIQIQQEKKEARQTQGKAQSIQELIAIGKERGYKNPSGWAYKVFNGRKRNA